MSQSDYIQRKRIFNELTEINQSTQTNIPNYTLYKQYSLENTITNTSKRYNQLLPPGVVSIFNMQITNPVTCPSFVLCNTQTRLTHTNSSPVSFNPYVSARLPYVNSYTATTTYTPNQLKYVKQLPKTKCSADCHNNPRKNNENTWYTAVRMNQLLCDCSMN